MYVDEARERGSCAISPPFRPAISPRHFAHGQESVKSFADAVGDTAPIPESAALSDG
jgi:hypothetical protein